LVRTKNRRNITDAVRAEISDGIFRTTAAPRIHSGGDSEEIEMISYKLSKSERVTWIFGGAVVWKKVLILFNQNAFFLWIVLGHKLINQTIKQQLILI